MPPYHHYHHTYYGRSASVGYQCGICGRYARAQQRVPQCGVCMTALCQACNQSGFCANHFAALTPEDQALARVTVLKTKRAQTIFVIGLVIGMVSFMLGIPLIVTSPLFYGGASIFVSIFVPMSLFIALVIGGSIYFQVTARRGWQTLQQIGQKYRTGQEVPMGAPQYPPAGPQGAYIPVQYPKGYQPPAPAASQALGQPVPQPVPISNKPGVRFCPFCGCNLAPEAQFCGNCGSALK